MFLYDVSENVTIEGSIFVQFLLTYWTQKEPTPALACTFCVFCKVELYIAVQ